MRLVELSLSVLAVGLPTAGLAGTPPAADDTERAIPYHTPEERREAGLGIRLAPWLSVSALLEIEPEAERQRFVSHAGEPWSGEATVTGQAAPEIALGDRFTAEAVLEWEDDGEGIVVDEWFVGVSGETWDLAAGRLYLPFGIYYSHFVTGPAIEFAESRAGAVQLDVELGERLEAALYAFDDKNGTGTLGWGASLEAKTRDERHVLGLGYLSGIASVNAGGSGDSGDPAADGAGAWSAYALLRFDSWEVTLETVATEHALIGTGGEAERIWSANVEAGIFLGDAWELAARVEHSHNVSDTPQRQYGVAATWRASRNLSMSCDYLYGSYAAIGGGEDDDAPRRREIVAARVAIEF